MSVEIKSAVESQPIILDLEEDEVAILRGLGTELASNRDWWGESAEQKERSVISIEVVAVNRYKVTFRDVIGAVRLNRLHIHVQPKISAAHFQYLIERSDVAPKSATRSAEIESGEHFVELLARWFVDSAEKLLRQGLRQEYSEHVEALPEIRGKLLPIETAMTLYRGNLLAHCEYDELSEDTDLNRLVKGSCERISKLNLVSEETKKRAQKIKFRMNDVGPLRWTDHRAKPDRLSKNYTKTCSLAQLILGGCGITSTLGKVQGTSFLIRTPELVEDGFRNILSQELPSFGIIKRKLMLGNTGLSMSPDLVFGRNVAIGDVKYRYLSRHWNRSDLYQVVAFATAFGATEGAVFGFVDSKNGEKPKSLPVGTVNVKTFGWVATSNITPGESCKQIVSDVRKWLN